MELVKFALLSIGGAAVSTAVIAAIARPLILAIQRAVLPRQEVSRTYTVSAAR